jgi:hypothetical protein
VFAGGLDEGVDPALVAADGTVSTETYPGSVMTGGFAVFELPNREAAEEWARKLAVSCRCSQELREFMYDPQS